MHCANTEDALSLEAAMIGLVARKSSILAHPIKPKITSANDNFFISLSPLVLQKVSTEIYSVVPSLSVLASIPHTALAGSDAHTDGGAACYPPAVSLHGSTCWPGPA